MTQYLVCESIPTLCPIIIRFGSLWAKLVAALFWNVLPNSTGRFEPDDIVHYPSGITLLLRYSESMNGCKWPAMKPSCHQWRFRWINGPNEHKPHYYGTISSLKLCWQLWSIVLHLNSSISPKHPELWLTGSCRTLSVLSSRVQLITLWVQLYYCAWHL